MICQRTYTTGGWLYEMKPCSCISPSLLQCFCGVLNNQVGVNYEIISLLGTQIVAGTNYLLLAKQTLMTNPIQVNLVTVHIYRDFTGTCSLASVTTIM